MRTMREEKRDKFFHLTNFRHLKVVQFTEVPVKSLKIGEHFQRDIHPMLFMCICRWIDFFASLSTNHTSNLDDHLILDA